jgi:hypothetical protein
MPGSTACGIKNAVMSKPTLFPENVGEIRYGQRTALGRRAKIAHRALWPWIGKGRPQGALRCLAVRDTDLWYASLWLINDIGYFCPNPKITAT